MEIQHNPYKLTDDTVNLPSAYPDKISGFPHQEPTIHIGDCNYIILEKLDKIISLLEKLVNEISPTKLKNY